MRFLFPDSLTAPNVTLNRVSPTSLRASWNSISVPVDSWSVTLSQVSRSASDDEDVVLSTIKVIALPKLLS